MLLLWIADYYNDSLMSRPGHLQYESSGSILCGGYGWSTDSDYVTEIANWCGLASTLTHSLIHHFEFVPNSKKL